MAGSKDTGDEERCSAAQGKVPATMILIITVASRCGLQSQHRVP